LVRGWSLLNWWAGAGAQQRDERKDSDVAIHLVVTVKSRRLTSKLSGTQHTPRSGNLLLRVRDEQLVM
jgi:streptomycin 6-kinase